MVLSCLVFRVSVWYVFLQNTVHMYFISEERFIGWLATWPYKSAFQIIQRRVEIKKKISYRSLDKTYFVKIHKDR